MNDRTDSQLLHAYAEQRSEAAFTELVRRHVDLVYSAARRMVCDAHLAEDVTQGVFVALAKNPGRLIERPVLSGWLHRTAQNIAAQTVRTDVRRRAREQEAAAMNELLAHAPDAPWEQIAPHLDAALGELNESDRDALLLRYFERKTAQEMALLLGVSEEAAQKRVSRAVERLREFLARRGVTAGAGGLVVVISTQAVEAAPLGLAMTISTAAMSSGATALVTSNTLLTMKMLNAKLAAFLLAAFLFGGVAYFVWEQKLRPAPAAPDPAAVGTLATKEMLYREMLAAGPIAGEVVESHPTYIYWQERRTALLQAGYIETRDIPLSKALSARAATGIFFDHFQKRFRGVQMGVRGLGNGDRPPVAYVTARKTDLGPTGAIEQFIRNYDPDKP